MNWGLEQKDREKVSDARSKSEERDGRGGGELHIMTELVTTILVLLLNYTHTHTHRGVEGDSWLYTCNRLTKTPTLEHCLL